MAAAQRGPQHSDGAAQAPSEPVVESVSPSRIESLKLPPRPGMHLGLDDRRGILDSPVLLPLLTVRQGSCCCPVLIFAPGWRSVCVIRLAGRAVADDWNFPSSIHSRSWIGSGSSGVCCSPNRPSSCPGKGGTV